jgi:hypothetical protein
MICTVLWDMTPCGLVEVRRGSGETHCIHLQIEQSSACFIDLACYLLGLPFYLEDGGSTFLRNGGYFCRLRGVASHKALLCILCVTFISRPRVDAVGIATGYWLGDRRVRVRAPERSWMFATPRCPATPTTDVVKKTKIYNSSPLYVFMP